MINKMKKNSNKSFDWVLAIILILALFMYGFKCWDAGNSNAFYTSAITSMTQNFKNFWFASFDPAGYITVDKPPVALWFMAISAKIFGIHGWSVVLPSILFGVGSVALINFLVKNHFGRLAGYISAIAMIFTPIVVADSRTNNIDPTLVFFLILAIYLLDRAIRKNNIWLVILSFGLIGIAFNIKMLQAFMVLPAMYLFYWLASNKDWKKKTGILSLSTIALVILMLIWPMSVDMISANNRPYEGGSQTNSAMELAFGYNGVQRLLGQSTGIGSGSKGMGSKNQSKGQNQQQSSGHDLKNSKQGMQGKPGSMKGQKISNQKNFQGMPNHKSGMKKGGPGGSGGGAFNIGTAGPLRLFQSSLGPQISWLLPFAIFSLISGLVYYGDSRRKWYQLTRKQNQMILWAGWLVPVAGFFSVASFFHPYYTIMLAPPIAALFGIGVTTMYKQMKAYGYKHWQYYLFPIAMTITACLQSWYAYNTYPWLSWIILGLIVILNLIFLIKKDQMIKLLVTLASLIILILPAWWSLTPTISGSSSMIPSAGPSLLSSSSQSSGGMMGDSINNKMLNYLEKHDGNAKYLFATSDSNTADPYIIKTKKAVMAMGGFNGTDPAMTLTKFKQLVKNGDVKYYYASGRSSSNSVVQWIQEHGKKVDSKQYQARSNKNNNNKGSGSHMQGGGPGSMGGSSATLYDLSGIYK